MSLKYFVINILLLVTPMALYSQISVSAEYGFEIGKHKNSISQNAPFIYVHANQLDPVHQDFFRLEATVPALNENMSLGVFTSFHSNYIVSYTVLDVENQPFDIQLTQPAVVSGQRFGFGGLWAYGGNLPLGADAFFRLSLRAGVLFHRKFDNPPVDYGEIFTRVSETINLIGEAEHKAIPFLNPGFTLGYKWFFLRGSYLHPLAGSFINSIESESTTIDFSIKDIFFQAVIGVKYQFGQNTY